MRVLRMPGVAGAVDGQGGAHACLLRARAAEGGGSAVTPAACHPWGSLIRRRAGGRPGAGCQAALRGEDEWGACAAAACGARQLHCRCIGRPHSVPSCEVTFCGVHVQPSKVLGHERVLWRDLYQP